MFATVRAGWPTVWPTLNGVDAASPACSGTRKVPRFLETLDLGLVGQGRADCDFTEPCEEMSVSPPGQYSRRRFDRSARATRGH